MNKILLFIFVYLFIFSLPLNLKAATKYDLIVAKLNKINEEFPNNTQIFSIGKNDQDIDILGIKVFLQNNTIENRINHLLVAVHHGNEATTLFPYTTCALEATTADLAIRFAYDLLAIYSDPANPYFEKYKNIVMHIVPVLNISGYNSNSRYEKAANGKSYDPNRDYKDPCYDHETFKLKSTKALVDYIEANDIIGAVTAHGYIGTFTFPWGTYALNTKTLYHEFYTYLAKASTYFNKYSYGTHADVIYPAIGSFEDFTYYTYGIWSMLIELKRYNDVDKDSHSLIHYFSLVPPFRSKNNIHGQCRKISRDEFLRSRP